ncbi:hypothetical protein HPP92_012806 [Vanilla planifolia]|uniref:Uncharacterized protein n=1 Tax=Vanilla planifolia TaxID=51239 RepID=A0A835UXW4_VANPL|nr:hypothetical protein HPP92_012806 [Vanilla planifolia]
MVVSSDGVVVVRRGWLDQAVAGVMEVQVVRAWLMRRLAGANRGGSVGEMLWAASSECLSIVLCRLISGKDRIRLDYRDNHREPSKNHQHILVNLWNSSLPQ